MALPPARAALTASDQRGSKKSPRDHPTPCRRPSDGGTPSISARRVPERTVDQFSPTTRAWVRGSAVRDAQAGVPSAEWPRAQLAFKDSMVRGILQFTPSIAFRYVLHRCESRDIRCRESSNFFESPLAALGADGGARRRTSSHSPSPAPLWVLGANRALGASVVRRARPSAGAAAGGSPASPRPASSRCRGGRGGPPSRCVMVTQFAGLPSFGPRQ